MISFQSENLIQKIFKTDDVDITSHITPQKMDHIFKNYIYHTTTEKFGNNGQIKINYEFRTDKIEEMFNDEYLGNVLIFQLSYHYINDILNSNEIYILTNLNTPNYMYVYFNQQITPASYSILTNIEKSVEFYTEHIFAINNINYKKLSIINENTDWFISNKLETITKKITNDIIIVDENYITELDITQAFNYLYVNTNLNKSDIKTALRFAFKLSIFENNYFIFFNNNYNNYLISNKLKNIFKLMDNKISNTIQKQKEISYLYVNEPTFIDNFSQPTIFIKGNFLFTNNYLNNYIKLKYTNNTTEIVDNTQFTNIPIEIKKNIIKYIDDIGKGIAYFDFDSNMVNSIIGDLNDYQYLNIYGYDEANQRPIILAIGKDYYSAGNYFRSIKIISGGITAINNDELKNDIVSLQYTYLLNVTLINVQNVNCMDMFKTISQIQNFPVIYPKEVSLFNPLNSDYKIFYNDKEIIEKGNVLNGQIYKQTTPTTFNALENQKFIIKLFILDVIDGQIANSTYSSLKSIEFLLNGEIVNPPLTEITCYGDNITNFNYLLDNNIIKIDTGTVLNRQNTGDHKRTIAVFTSPIICDTIKINNFHAFGSDISSGLKNFNIYIANFEYSNVISTYGSAVNALTLLSNVTNFPKHIAANVADDKNITLTQIDYGDAEKTHVYKKILLDKNSFNTNDPKNFSQAIPYDAIIDLFTNVNNTLTMNTFLNKYFQTTDTTESIDLENISYNNLFIKYIPIISGIGMHQISHQDSVVGFRTINQLLLEDVLYDVKIEILNELYKTTDNNIIYNFLQGTNIVTEINDDSEFNINSQWPLKIFTTNIENVSTKYIIESTKSEFLTNMMHENMYQTFFPISSGFYICGLFKMVDIMKYSYNGSIVFNKVIGNDQYSQYSLKSDSIDITFSEYFINCYTDNFYTQLLLDLDNGKIKNLGSTPFEFNCGTANPIISNMELANEQKYYLINKNDYSNINNNYYNVFKIYDILPEYQIVYSIKPFNEITNQIFNIYSNEQSIVQQQ